MVLNSLRFEHLMIFLQVVDAKSFSGAATALNDRQPRISRAIRELETELRVDLFTRTGRGVELTAAGERFLVFAKDMTDAFEASLYDMRAVADTLASEISIGVLLGSGWLLAPPLHKAFASRLPEVETHIIEDSQVRLVEGVRSGRYDIALFYSDSGAVVADQETLFDEVLYVVGVERLIGADPDPITLAEVARLPLLLPKGTPYRHMIDARFRQASLKPNIVRELDSASAYMAFAAEGDGVCILAYSNIHREVMRGELVARVICDPEIARSICMGVTSKIDRRLAMEARVLIRETLNQVSHLARWTRRRTSSRN